MWPFQGLWNRDSAREEISQVALPLQMKRRQNMEAEVLDGKLVQEPRHKELAQKVEREKIPALEKPAVA